MNYALLLNVSPIVAGLLAALAFYIGSFGIPHDKISWDGETEFENRRHLRQLVANCLGLLFTAVTAVLSLMIVLR
jgi:hypothetical protein